MRIVIKVGTSTLAHTGGRLNIRRVELLCKVMSDLKNAGNEVVLVSSGAIGMGVGKLGLHARPKDIPTKQAAAAVGQCELMYTYDKLFSEYHHTVAQILLTAEDIQDGRRSKHVHDTLERLLGWGALPVINENDRVRIINALKCVDEAVLIDIETTNDKMVALEKFGFDVLFSGDDWKGTERYLKTESQFAPLGVSIEYLPYTQGVSTSDLKDKMKKG